MRIIHLADIHVKDQRRDEFRYIFDKTAESIRTLDPKPDVIAIAGDIFDTMSKASARNWEDVAYLLTILSEIAPVVLIPGNHDLNVRAEDAPDLIGPMLNAAGGALNLQPPRVNYFKYSDVYEFADMVWITGVPGRMPASLDKLKTILDQNPGKPLVGLYHESVTGAKYPNGIEAAETPLSKSNLSDLVRIAGPDRVCAILLGDIHLRQEIDFELKSPIAKAWYPGSMLCLSFGEHHNGHGYLIWDYNPQNNVEKNNTENNNTENNIENNNKLVVTPVDIYNPVAPLTIKINAAGEDITQLPIPETPKSYRIKYDVNIRPDIVLSDIVDLYADKFKFKPRTIDTYGYLSNEPDIPIESVGTAELVEHKTNNLDWLTHVKLANQILDSNNTPENIKQSAISMYELNISNGLGLNVDAPRAELMRLEFSNMFCYGNNNIVDFDALRNGRPGLVGFVAPNRAGKSSLFDIITFALCDEFPRGSKRDIARRNGPGFKLRLTFRIDNKIGIIEKSGSRGELKRSDHMIKLWYDGEELTGDTITETANIARGMLGDLEWLNEVVFLRPTEVTGSRPFSLSTPADRRKVLSSLLKLGSFDEYLTSANNEIKSARVIRRTFLKKIEGMVNNDPSSWKEGTAATYLNTIKNEYISKLSIIESQLTQLTDMINIHTDDITKLKTNIDSNAVAVAKEQLMQKTMDLKSITSQQTDNQLRIEKIKSKIIEYKNSIPKTNTDDISNIELQITQISEEIKKLQHQLLDNQSNKIITEYPNIVKKSTSVTRPTDDLIELSKQSQPRLYKQSEFQDINKTTSKAINTELAHISDIKQNNINLSNQSNNRQIEFNSIKSKCTKCMVNTTTVANIKKIPEIELAAFDKLLDDIIKVGFKAATYRDIRKLVSTHLVAGCKGCEHTNITLGTSDKDRFNELRKIALEKYPSIIEYYTSAINQINTQIAENNKKIKSHEDETNRIKIERNTQIESMNNSNTIYDKWNNAVLVCTKYNEFCKSVLSDSTSGDIKTVIDNMKLEYDMVINQINNNKSTLLSKQKQLFEFESNLSKIKSADGVIITINSHINDLEKELHELNNTVDVQKQLIADANESVNILTDSYTSVLTEQVKYAEELQVLNTNISNLQNKYNVLNTGEYMELKNKYNIFLENMTDIIKFDTQVATLAAYRLLLHPKNGIGAKLLENAVSDITHQLESALLSMEANFTFEFTSEYELSLIDRVTGLSIPPSLGSGYQQFVLALAVRWAISKVAKIPLPACFMIDEGFGCLDDINLPKVVEALATLALQDTPGSIKPIMIAVTHREDMDPYFSERLRIQTQTYTDETGKSTSVSNITYPHNSSCNLENINLQLSNSIPPKYCELCKCEVAAVRWQNHLQSVKHIKMTELVNIGGVCSVDDMKLFGTPAISKPQTTECIYCKCLVENSKLDKHNLTKVHITKKQNYESIRLIKDPNAELNTNYKLLCKKCANGCEYSVKQWEKHILTKKHLM
jgi:DNA repair exonuclease SbcCD nuclease subunit